MGKLKPGNRTAITRFQLKPPLFLDDAVGATEARATASHFITVCATRITAWNFESMSMRPFCVVAAEAGWTDALVSRFRAFAFYCSELLDECRIRGTSKHM